LRPSSTLLQWLASVNNSIPPILDEVTDIAVVGASRVFQHILAVVSAETGQRLFFSEAFELREVKSLA
jgi:hypothetical protein